MSKAKVIVPFRDRGLDARRGANLEVVMAWWWAHGLQPEVVDDGLTGDAQFNRHRAYNRAVAANPDVDVFIFTEADMLIPIAQIGIATKLAIRRPGLIVPFTQYRYLSDESTAKIRDYFHDLEPHELAQWINLDPMNPTSIFSITPESTMDNGASIGAVNVVSRETLDITGGFTEATSGNWYDDNIIEEGFTYLTQQKTSFVPGPAVHMYHLPGWTGDHLSEADKAATQRNKNILLRLRADVLMRNGNAVRELMAIRQEDQA